MTQSQFDSEGLDTFFTDVEELRDYFAGAIAAETLPKRILVVWGVGGIGKTTLLRMFRLHSKRNGVPVGLASGDDESTVIEVLARWSQDLANDGVKLKNFAKSLDRYRAIQSKVDDTVRETRGWMEKTGRTLALKTSEAAAGAVVGGALGSMVPGAGTVVGASVGSVLAASSAEGVWDLVRGHLSKSEADLWQNSQEKLTGDFLADIAKAAGMQRLVLMLDTFERLPDLYDWLRELVRHLDDNALIVIAGRGPLDWGRHWPEWPAHVHVEELEPMDEATMRQLVRRYYAFSTGGKRPNPEQVERVIRFSRGLPMIINTVVSLWAKYGVEDFEAHKPEVVSDLVDRLREGVPADLYPAFEAASTMRWFNEEILQVLLGTPDVRTVYDELKRFPFVRSRQAGLAVHDVIREFMEEYLKIEHLSRYRQLHSSAAGYFESAATALPVAEAEQYVVEQFYHLLRVSESAAIDLLETQFERARWLGHWELQQKMLAEAAAVGFRQPAHQHRYQFLRARMETNWAAQERLLKRMLDEDSDSMMRVRVLRALSGPLGYQNKRAELVPLLEEAIAICEAQNAPLEAAWTRLELCWQVDVDESLRLIDQARRTFEDAGDDPGLANAYAQLGWNHLNRWEAAEARSAFLKSIALLEKVGDRREAAFIQERVGQTYLIEGDFHAAIRAKEAALKVFEQMGDQWHIAWTLDEIATCAIWIGRLESTLSILDRAKAVFAEWNDRRQTACVARQASIYREQGRLDLAKETYQKALRTLPFGDTWARYEIYSGQGRIHLQRSEFEAASSCFSQARQTFEEKGKTFEATMTGGCDFGDLHLALGKSQEAIEYYGQCLSVATSQGHRGFECAALVGQSRGFYALQQWDAFDEAARLAEAVARQYRYQQLLADTHLLRGHRSLQAACIDSAKVNPAGEYYQQALIAGLFHNRFKLDRVLQAIIQQCATCHEASEQVLTALRDWWQNGSADTGAVSATSLAGDSADKTLVKLEHVAREREPGDGAMQHTVLQAIDQALSALKT